MLKAKVRLQRDLICLLFWIAFFTLRVRESGTQLNHQNGVSIWIPYDYKTCKGDFIMKSLNNAISMVIRDVTTDDRHVSLREAKKKFKEKAFRRVQIFFSVIPNPQLEMHTEISGISSELDTHAELLFPNLSRVFGVTTVFDYFLEDQPFQRNCNTYKTCRVREWQATLTIVDTENVDAVLSTKIEKLVSEGVSLHLKLPVMLRYSNKTSLALFKVSLGCFEGLSTYEYLAKSHSFTHEVSKCFQLKNSIAISGAPLFGSNRDDVNQWRNIAHYASRHLFGHTWYDTVAIALLPKYTLSHIQSECQDEESCISLHLERNLEYMKHVRFEVEKELRELEIPSKEWNRIILFQFCSLGSDYTNTESNEPCAASFHGGQKILGLLGYTRFGSHFAWSSNFDLDELLVDELANARRSNREIQKLQSAGDRFNLLRDATNKTSFYALWMDFSVPKMDQRDFTRKVISGERIGFKSKDSESNELKLSECYGGGGKVFAHCSTTAGLLAHYALRVEKDRKLSQYKCVPPRTKRRTYLFRTIPLETEMYTWHVRNPPRQGNCLFDAFYRETESGCSIRPRASINCTASVSES